MKKVPLEIKTGPFIGKADVDAGRMRLICLPTVMSDKERSYSYPCPTHFIRTIYATEGFRRNEREDLIGWASHFMKDWPDLPVEMVDWPGNGGGG